MKAFQKLTAVVVTILLLLVLTANLLFLGLRSDSGKAYRVDISRAAQEIRETGLENLDLDRYPSLAAVTAGAGPDFLECGESPCAFREIQGELYRFDYREAEGSEGKQLGVLNGCLGAAGLLVLGLLFYLREQVLKPFDEITHLPQELAKGNLTIPVKQQKSRYFGNFLWGMDLLREKLE